MCQTCYNGGGCRSTTVPRGKPWTPAGNKHPTTSALQGLQVTAAELYRLQHRLAHEVPLPDLRSDVILIIKLTPHDDIEAYLRTCKRTSSGGATMLAMKRMEWHSFCLGFGLNKGRQSA